MTDRGLESGYDPDGPESLVLRISNEFINLPVEEIDRKIVDTLETLARFAGATRGSVFLLSEDGTTADNTHEWCADPADSQQHLLRGVPFAQFGHYAQLLRGFSTVAVGAARDLPPEAVGERRWIEEHGFRSLLFVPMRLTGRLVGTLGFYGPLGENRVWSGRYAYLLEFAAVAIVNALERRKYEAQRRELEELARAARLLRVERALRSTLDAEAMMRRVLDVVRAELDAGRALLVRPCDPEAPSWCVAMERAAEGEAGGSGPGAEASMDPIAASLFGALNASESPVAFGARDEPRAPALLGGPDAAGAWLGARIQGPRDASWALLVQDRAAARAWSADERALLQDIAWRVGDALDSVLTFRDLQESQARFMAVFDYAPVMIHSLDPDGRIRLWNHDCSERLGWTPEEIRGSRDPLGLLFAEGDERRRKRESIERADGSFERYDVIAKDGTTRVQLWADFRLPSGQVFSVGHDVTDQVRRDEERREFDRRLLHTQKLESLGVLAGGIAHDFNNLLVGVVGNLDLARTAVDPASPASEYLSGAEQAALQVADLSRQMLAYSGKGAFVVEPLDLSALVESMKPILAAAVDKKVAVEFRLAESIPAVSADPTQLRQVVLNLLVNASEALGGRPGRISVRTGVERFDRAFLRTTYVDDGLAPGEYVFLDVTDTGEGMDADTCAMIFEPFYSTKFAGRGLGLAAALGIARGHGGAFWVQSEPGRGSTFRLLLPPTARRPARVPEVASSAWRGEGVVLLADDEPTVREVARRMIARFGFEVLTARDGGEAVELFAAHRDRIVAVVLDVTMPVLDGPEALSRIRSLDATIPVVLSSGYSRAAVVDDAATVFLQKPFTVAAVEAALRAVS